MTPVLKLLKLCLFPVAQITGWEMHSTWYRPLLLPVTTEKIPCTRFVLEILKEGEKAILSELSFYN